jgi:hypothetical protein
MVTAIFDAIKMDWLQAMFTETADKVDLKALRISRGL